jgi:hypothetical protein
MFHFQNVKVYSDTDLCSLSKIFYFGKMPNHYSVYFYLFIYIFICDLCNDATNSSEYIAGMATTQLVSRMQLMQGTFNNVQVLRREYFILLI